MLVNKYDHSLLYPLADADCLGKVIYRGAAGPRAKENDKDRMSTDSLCWVASFTKLATAVAVMQVVEQGLVHLDDDIRCIVPELKDLRVLAGFGNIAPTTAHHELHGANLSVPPLLDIESRLTLR